MPIKNYTQLTNTLNAAITDQQQQQNTSVRVRAYEQDVVDTMFGLFTSASTMNADNGLTWDGNTVVWGGTLTGTTVINANGNRLTLGAIGDLDINAAKTTIRNLGSPNAAIFQMASGTTIMGLTGGTPLFQLDFDSLNNKVEFKDNRQSSARSGIEYQSDYSLTYTNRSLIDRGYFLANTSAFTTGSTANFVPYTGATQNVNLGAFTMDASLYRLSSGVALDLVGGNILRFGSASGFIGLDFRTSGTTRLSIDASGNISANNNQIKNLAAATAATDAVIYSQVTGLTSTGVTLSSTQIGFGSSSNTLTGSNLFTYVPSGVSISLSATGANTFIGHHVGSTFANAIYILGTGTSRNANNYTLRGDQTNTELNSPNVNGYVAIMNGQSITPLIIRSTGTTAQQIFSIRRSQNAFVTNLNIDSGTGNTSVLQINTDHATNNAIIDARNGFNLVIQNNDVDRLIISTTGITASGTTVIKPRPLQDGLVIDGRYNVSTGSTLFQVINSNSQLAFQILDSDLKGRWYGNGGINYPAVSFIGNTNAGLGGDPNNGGSTSLITGSVARLVAQGNGKISTESNQLINGAAATAATDYVIYSQLTAATGTTFLTNTQVGVGSTANTLSSSTGLTFNSGTLRSNRYSSVSTTANYPFNADNTANDGKFLSQRSGGNNFSFEHDASSFYLFNGSTGAIMWRAFNAGNVVIGSGSTSNQRLLRVNQESANIDIGSLVGNSAVAAVYMNQAVPSGLNFILAANGTSNQLNAPSGQNVIISNNNNARIISNSSNTTFALGAGASDQINYQFTVPTAVGNTANLEFSSFKVNGSPSKQWNTGTVPLQREYYFSASILSAVSTSNFTNVYGMFIEQPLTGSNVTFTNPFALGITGNLHFSGNNSTIVMNDSTGTKRDVLSFAGDNVRIAGIPNSSDIYLNVVNANTGVIIKSNGAIGIRNSTPTALLHIGSGGTASSTAPLKFTSGSTLTTTEAGAIEYDGNRLYLTPNNLSRQQIGIAAFKDVADSAALTGTSNTILKSIFVSANTFTTGDFVKVFSDGAKTGSTGTFTQRWYVNTGQTITGAVLLGLYTSTAAANLWASMDRTIVVKNNINNTQVFTTGTSSNTDVTSINGARNTAVIDFTKDQYFMVAIQNAGTGDTSVVSAAYVQRI